MIIRWLIIPALYLCCFNSLADIDPRFAVISAGSDLVGSHGSSPISESETLIDIAARNKMGYNLIRSANPQIDAWLPAEGSTVLLPFKTILPMAPRIGIVINTSEMRLYVYLPNKNGEPGSVYIYPISIGRGNWATPVINTRVTGRVEDPVWYPPESIRLEHAARGDELAMQIPPGPSNPLGKYMLTLDIPGYFIHGTNRSFGIGMQVTHGCIRMYPDDIAQLLQQVPNNTPVTIIRQNAKAGWHNGELYLEVHPPLEGEEPAFIYDKTHFISTVVAASEGYPTTQFDWDKIDRVIDEAKGLPEKVGYQLPPSPYPVSDSH